MPDAKGPIRIVVHAGFHKTGTTTVQQTLRQNARILWPIMAIGLRPKLVPILQAARGYSTWRDPLSLMKFGDRVDRYLAGLNLSANRMLCLSAEELSGHLPGRDAVPDYGAAPALMREFAQVAAARFGPALDLRFYFSTRGPDAWLESAWAEHVKASRMTRDLTRFIADTRPAADLPAVVNAIRTAVSPHRVHSTTLEETAPLPFGPAQPLIDLLALPPRRAAQLKPVARPANTSLPPDILDQMLALNRSDLPRPAVNAAKAALLSQKPA